MQMLSEDLPDPANTISINSAYKDSLGLPGIKMHYRLSDYSRAVLPQMMEDYVNWVQVTNGKPRTLPGAWSSEHHLMGTTIMGTDPKDSVVDPDLRCHDHGNMFLVTTGVMPTSSCVNPTLTGMALAIRAGRTIAAEV
ncbi:MAG: GMC oxidoreductase [Neorhizobium sp.]|nr:GMC oxidoreductase [Neorhizobium sp.]